MRITVELTDELAEVTAAALEHYAFELHQRLRRIVREHRSNEEFHYLSHRVGEARVAARMVRAAMNDRVALSWADGLGELVAGMGLSESELRAMDGNR